MKNISFHILIACFLVFQAQNSFAETVSVSKAEQVARNFASTTITTKSSMTDVKLVYTGNTTKASSEAPYYVFSTGDKGFVVIAGDDGMMPVLGYSSATVFNANDIPDGLELLLECYNRNVQALRSGNAQPLESATPKWSELLQPTTKASTKAIAVRDLQTALWDQYYPYNDSCPSIDEETCLTGCGPTAISIVMKHYGWPESGYGTVPAYTTETNGIDIAARSLGHAYDWDNMLYDYSNWATDEQMSAVATLMADVGHIMKADYGTEGTSVYTSAALDVTQYMKYGSSAALKYRSIFTTEEWCNMLKAELDGNHPIPYAGGSLSQGGHYYVIDGYDSEGRFKFNWGWGGYGNGFFYISDTEFSNDEGAVFNFAPDKQWTEPTTGYALTYYNYQNDSKYYGIWSEKAYIEDNDSVKINVQIANLGTADYNGNIRFSIEHANGESTVLLEYPCTIISNEICILSFSCKFGTVSEGDVIVGYYSTGENTWLPIDGGVKTVPLRYNIEDKVSLEYNKESESKILKVYSLCGMTITWDSGTPVQLSYESPYYSVTNPTGTHTLTVSNGHDSYSVSLTFPE